MPKYIWAGGAFRLVPDEAGPGDPPQFDGPIIPNLTLLVNVAMSNRDYSGTFSGGAGPLTFTLIGTPPAGVTLSSAGVLSGTPTETGVFAGLVVRASDGTDTSDSNTFTLTVLATFPEGGTYGKVVRRPVRALIRLPVRKIGG